LILVDTNVLFDVVTESAWADWSTRQLEDAELQGPLGINAIIFAEFSVRYDSVDETKGAVEDFGLSILDIPYPALFLAGRAFRQYRKQKGAAKTGVLPDFLIGAHAAVLGAQLLTRDADRYRTYFPTVELITP
jgi:predicted nucleic acid-binding protein